MPPRALDRAVCIHGHFSQPPRENPWLEAVETHDWLRAVFWLAIGLVFLRADGLRREQ